MAELESLCSSGRYDVVVVDCAPTAETLRLLSLPDVASWYLRRIHPTRAPSEPDGEPSAPAPHVVAGGQGRGVRGRGTIRAAARSGAPDPGRSGHHDRPTGDESRAHGGRRITSDLRFALAVRIFRRCHRREQDAPRDGHRPLVRPVAGRPAGDHRCHQADLPRRPRSAPPTCPITRSRGSRRCAPWARTCGTASTPRPDWWIRPSRVEPAGADMVLTIELPNAPPFPRSVSTGSATS